MSGMLESEHFLVEVQRAFPIEGRARSPVEAVSDAVEVGLGMHREIAASVATQNPPRMATSNSGTANKLTVPPARMVS